MASRHPPATRSSTSTHLLDPSYQDEVKRSFDVLDEERTGYITPHALKTLIRALGFRVTREDIMDDIEAAKQRRQRDGIGTTTTQASYNSCKDGIDIDMVCDILAQGRYYGNNNRANMTEELHHTFRLFDTDGTGIITLDNLKQVAEELRETAGRNGRESDTTSIIDDDMLRAMIESFDRDLDGGISFDEFRRIIECR